MANGSCLCGKIAYECDTVGPDIAKCHCTICQKSSGSAYADFTSAPIDKFRWAQGEELLAKYESSPGTFRNFCPNCGTHLPSPHPPLGIVFIPAGTLDSKEPLREAAHMFLRSKADWHKLEAGLKEFQEYPG